MFDCGVLAEQVLRAAGPGDGAGDVIGEWTGSRSISALGRAARGQVIDGEGAEDLLLVVGMIGVDQQARSPCRQSELAIIGPAGVRGDVGDVDRLTRISGSAARSRAGSDLGPVECRAISRSAHVAGSVPAADRRRAAAIDVRMKLSVIRPRPPANSARGSRPSSSPCSNSNGTWLSRCRSESSSRSAKAICLSLCDALPSWTARSYRVCPGICGAQCSGGAAAKRSPSHLKDHAPLAARDVRLTARIGF